MKIKIAAVLLAGFIPTGANAWVELGTYYEFGVIQIQLGDVCDSARFPLTPGTCAGDASNPDWRLEIEEAIFRWHDETDNFTFVTDPDPGATMPGECDSGDPNSVFFLDDICGSAFGGSTLAVARTFSFSVFDGVSIHSDVIINTAFTWGAFDDELSNHPGVIDIRRVLVHEFGHVAGLGHVAHENAIMAPLIQETIITPQPDDVAGLNAIYGATMAIAIADQNSNGSPELVSMRRESLGDIFVEVRDSTSGALLRSMNYLDGGHEPIDLVLIDDEDASGAPEVGVLAIRYSDGRALVEIRNISGAENPRTVAFAPGSTPLQIKNIGDADGNGVDEIALLAIRWSDARSFVEIRNSFGPVARRNIYLPAGASGMDLEVFPDPADPSVPRLAVLMVRWSDLRNVVEFRNSIDAEAPSRVFTRAGVTAQAISVFDNPTIPGYQLAVLSTRDSDLRTLVEVMGVDGSSRSTKYLREGDTPYDLRAIGDADADGQPDFAVLSRRDSDGRIVVQVRNADDSNKRSFTQLAGMESTGTLIFLGDADGDTFEEYAVLLSRNTDARLRIDWANAAGPDTSTINRVYLSP